MKRQRMNNKGFTLIETTVAMLVMLIVGLSASSLFLYSVRYNSGASQRSVAMAVAQQRLEVLRGTEYDNGNLDFGTYGPETVVISSAMTTSYTQGSSVGGDQSYDAPVAASSYTGGGFNPSAAATPTPTPTPGGGTTGGSAPSGSNTFQIQTEIVPFPIGVSAAAAKQKQITIRVVPVNGNGNNAWANQNPVVVVFRRSVGAPGPYKQ